MLRSRTNTPRLSPRFAKHPIHSRRTRLFLSALEDRCVPAQFTVSNTLDGPVTMAGELPGSLRQAIFDANALGGVDDIVFDALLFSTPQVINLTANQLDIINDGLNILGPGAANVTISGAAAAGATNRIFNINVPVAATITFDGVTIANGNLSAGNGGGILAVDETLEFTNVTLLNNRAAANGGAIATSGAGANITLTNCSLIGNAGTATSSTGGAINIGAAATITVNTSLLERNSAGASGGAIHAAATSNITVNAGSTFSGNSVGTASTTTGGAINLGGASTITINAATFRGNLAGGSGGAIHTNATSNLNVTAGTVFDNNSAVTTGTNAGGGALSIGPVTATTTGTATITGATFINNRAPNGGALRIGSSATSTVTINTSLFSGNRASAAAGGAISMTTGAVTVNVKIDNSSLVNNEAGTTGGAIAMNNQSVTIRNSTLSGNAARSFATAGGGAIFVGQTAFSGSLNIHNSTITNNMAADSRTRGGGIYISRTSGTGTFLLSSTILAGNSAPTDPDISGPGTATIPLVTAKQSLIGVVNPATINVAATGGFIGNDTMQVDPGLLPLGHFGGNLPVHGLKTTSVAINAGNDDQSLGTDQRGAGFTRTIGTADIGAVEGEMLNPYGQAALADVTATGPSYAVTVVYTDNVAVDPVSIGTDDVLLAGPGYAMPVSPISVGAPVVSGNTVTVTYTFTAPGSSWDTADNGNYTLSLVDGAVLDTGGPAAGTFAGPLGFFRAAIGANFVVDNNLSDFDDGNYGVGELTLREAIELSNRTNVGVADKITFNGSSPNLFGPIVLSSEIVVNDSVNIVGLGQANTSISGGGLTRIFNTNIYSAFGSLNISQLTLLDGRVTAVGGGAILLTDDFLNLTQVTLTNNSSQGASGGAILSLNSDARMVLSQVTAGSNTTSVNGGVIATSSGFNQVTISNSTFTMNTANTSGGVINGSSSTTLTISGSTFANNTAIGDQGGAINVGNGVTTITNSVFQANNSAQQGGAFAIVSGGQGFIGDSTFTFNTCAGEGGALYQANTGTNVIYDGCVFTSNSATGRGGVGLMSSTFAATFIDCEFNQNSSAGDRGGALYLGAGTMTIMSSKFDQNSTTGFGGAISSSTSSPATYVISDSTFTNNTAATFGGAMGLDHTSSSITINNSLFSANSAGTFGGAIGSSDSISINASNSTFADNFAGTSVGGAIGSSSGAGTVYTIDDCKFLRNSGQTGGALYAVTGLTFNITDTLFEGNRAHSSGALGGGAIRGGGGNASYSNCTFSFNTSANHAGAISHTTGPVTVTVNGCIFNDNYASSNSGALGTPSGVATFNITNSSFLRNRAAGAGGVMHAASTTTFDCTNCVFDGNSSLDGPAGVLNFNSVSTVTLNKSTFTNNFADRGPGVVSLGAVNSSLSVTECTFDGNTGGEGGVIRSRLPDAVITVTRSTLSNNQARMGGGIAIGSDNTATLTGTVTVENSTLSGNRSTSDFFGGGAISIYGALWAGTLNIRNSTLVNNTAVRGGAIFDIVAGDTVGMTPPPDSVNIYSSIIANNTATVGRDMYFVVPHNVTVTKSLIGTETGSNANIAGDFDPLLIGVDTAPVDPGLYHLANNGGSTKTHALKVGSLALNAGQDNVGLASDQIGAMRKQGAEVDIGSFEGTLIVPIPSAVFANVPPAATDYIATVIYEDETGIDVGTIDITDVNITSPVLGAPLTPYQVITMGSGTKVTANYYFTPPGSMWDVADNGTYTVNLIGEVKDTDMTQNTMAKGSLGSFIVGFTRTFVVDITTDEDDGNTAPGDLSLREAIKLANSTFGSHDTITFDNGVFGSPQTIFLAMALGQMKITDSVTIQGPGVANLSIDAGINSRIFEISGPSLLDVSMSGMKLTNGKSANLENGGAALIVNANVTFAKMEIASSTSADDGGGFSVIGNSLTIQVVDSVITNNVSSSQAGGIHVNAASTVVVTRSSITGNSAANDGGGIYFPYNGGLIMDSSTVSGNAANVGSSGAGGGGIYFYGSIEGGGFRITNSTISGNGVGPNNGTGGGVHLANLIGNVLIENSTITGNNATTDGGGLAIKGVGVFALGDLTSLSNITLRSTIIANNTHNAVAQTALADIASYKATNITANNNLIGIQDASTNITLVGAANQVGDALTKLDALLDPTLASNGAAPGAPLTHALLPGSPAIDAGWNPNFIANDQRGPGFFRTSNDPMVANVTDATDIGAFEIQFAAPPPQVANIVIAGGTQRSMVQNIKVSFSEPVTLSPGAFEVKGYNLGPIGDVELDVSQLGNDVTISFKTGGVGFITLDPGLSLPDGQYELTIHADKISGAGGNLDGNKNGTYDGTPADSVSSKFHRLFGDADGTGSITAADFNAFRLVYGSVGPSIFDYDASNSVNAADFNSFRLRYGTTGYLP